MSNITKIVFRRGLDAQRQTVALQLGEPGYSTDTKRLFIGDGITLGGNPVGIVNYGVVAALSGSYVYNSSIQTNMSQAAFTLLSASNVGDIVYDQATTSLYTVSSTNTSYTSGTILNTLSNFAHLYSTTNFNSSQFYYNGTQLTIQNGQNGQGHGVGINEINASIVAGSPTLSGGSGYPLTIQTGGVSNNYIAPGPNNSVKITNGIGSVSDLAIGQNQLIGRTNYSGSTLGAVTLSATGSATLSANSNIIAINVPFFLPLSGGSLTGGVSALNANSGRFTTDVTPVLPTDVVNLNYISGFSCTQPAYLFSHFLALTGGTLTGPGTLNVNGVAYFGNNVSVVGSLSAGNIASTGNVNIAGGLSANSIQNFTTPVASFDVTNKFYTDSKFVPLSGATLTGRLYSPSTPSTAIEVANKGYVDSLQGFVGVNFLPLSGGTLTGNVSSTSRFYTTNNPVASAELTTKNYVDTQVTNATPVGCVAYFASATSPIGWVKANGAVLPIASYQNLFNTLPKQANGNSVWWLPGDGPTNFRLPDLRGQFIRGWNDGISNGNTTNTGTNPVIPTVDANRGIGTTQLDQFQGHEHLYDHWTGTTGGGGGINGYLMGDQGNISTSQPTTDSINGAPRYGSETRPTNIALLACIKY